VAAVVPVAIVVIVVIVPSSLSHSLSWSHPPESLVEGGGMLLVHHHCRTCSPRCSRPHCSPLPPHEQLLTAAVGGDVVVVAIILLVVSSPLWLLRGGGCWVVPVCVDVPAPSCHCRCSACSLCLPRKQSLAVVPCPHPCCSQQAIVILSLMFVVWSLSHLSVPTSTHDPPCEQWLAVVVAGAGSHLFRGSSDMAGIQG
jgi:hypothetical protein